MSSVRWGLVLCLTSFRFVRFVRFVSFRSFRFGFLTHNFSSPPSNLSEDATKIQIFSLSPITSALSSIVSILSGVIVSLVIMWPLGLIGLCTLPLYLILGRDANQRMHGIYDDNAESSEAGSILIQSLSSIRTVYALDLQAVLEKDYANASRTETKWDILRVSLRYGSSMCLQQFVNALLFWAGFTLIQNYEVFNFETYLFSFFAILFGMIGFITSIANLNGWGQANKAAIRIFKILERESEIDSLEGQEGVVAN